MLVRLAVLKLCPRTGAATRALVAAPAHGGGVAAPAVGSVSAAVRAMLQQQLRRRLPPPARIDLNAWRTRRLYTGGVCRALEDHWALLLALWQRYSTDLGRIRSDDDGSGAEEEEAEEGGAAEGGGASAALDGAGRVLLRSRWLQLVRDFELQGLGCGAARAAAHQASSRARAADRRTARHLRARVPRAASRPRPIPRRARRTPRARRLSEVAAQRCFCRCALERVDIDAPLARLAGARAAAPAVAAAIAGTLVEGGARPLLRAHSIPLGAAVGYADFLEALAWLAEALPMPTADELQAARTQHVGVFLHRLRAKPDGGLALATFSRAHSGPAEEAGGVSAHEPLGVRLSKLLQLIEFRAPTHVRAAVAAAEAEALEAVDVDTSELAHAHPPAAGAQGVESGSWRRRSGPSAAAAAASAVA